MALIWLLVSICVLASVVDAQLQGGCWLTKDDFPSQTSTPQWILDIEMQCYMVFSADASERKECSKFASRVMTAFVDDINTQNYASMTNRIRALMTDYLNENPTDLRRSVLSGVTSFRPPNGNLLLFQECTITKGACADDSVKLIFGMNSQSEPIVSAEMRTACVAKWKDAELEACRDCCDAIAIDIYSTTETLAQRKAVSKRLLKYSDSGKNANRTEFLKATEISGWGTLWQITECDQVFGNCESIQEIYKPIADGQPLIRVQMETACGVQFGGNVAENGACSLAAGFVGDAATDVSETKRTPGVIKVLNEYTTDGVNDANRKKFLEDTRISSWGNLSQILECGTVSGNCSLSKTDFPSTTSTPPWILEIDARCYTVFNTAALLSERKECIKFSSRVLNVFVEEISTENYGAMTSRIRTLMKDYIATNREERSGLLRGIEFRTDGTVRTLLDFANCVNAYGDCDHISPIFELDAYSAVAVSREMRKACLQKWASSASELEACNDCADAIEMDTYGAADSAQKTSKAKGRLNKYSLNKPNRVTFLRETDILGWGSLWSITQC